MALNSPQNPCEWCGSINDECPCAPDDHEHEYGEWDSRFLHVAGARRYCECGAFEHRAEDPREISELHVVGPGPNGYAVTDDNGVYVADGLSLEAARGYLS